MPYQSTPADQRNAYIIGAIYVLLAIALGWMLFKIWPPIPWPAPKDELQSRQVHTFLATIGCPGEKTESTTPAGTPTPDPTKEIISIPINFYKGKCMSTTFDERLLLLVVVAGILGAFVHGATSLADYIGNNNFNSSWTWFYLLRPPIGMSLALVFYFVIRGGFLSTTGGAADINPYGIAALAGLVGMFSKQATDKLGEVFKTLFRSAPGEGDEKRSDPLVAKTGGPSIVLDPASVVAGGDTFSLSVTGTGFVDDATVNLDDAPLTTTFESATKVRAEIAKEKIAQPGTLKISVVNPDQTKFGPVDLTVSPAAGGPTPPGGPPDAGVSPPAGGGTPPPAAPVVPDAATDEKPVDGEGGDQDLIDGCDVDMKPDTPDEDLPITKGGVE
jgi:hypothetical protein